MKAYSAVQVGMPGAIMNTSSIYSLIKECLPEKVSLAVSLSDYDKQANIRISSNGFAKDFTIDYGKVIVQLAGKLVILSRDNYLKYFWTFPDEIEVRKADLFGVMKCYSDEED